MKVVVVGLPLFARELVQKLSSFDSENTYKCFDTYYSKTDKLKYFLSVVNADVVVSLKGVAEESKALKWAKYLKKPILMGWMGSDVLGAQKLFQQKRMNNELINYAHHFTDAVWLQDELEEVGINSKILHFKTMSSKPSSPFPTSIGVSAYIGKGNEEFYGWNELMELAVQHKNVPFHVYGTDKSEVSIPDNVKIHGWIPKKAVQKILDENAIVYRNTKHDGNSQAIIEALTNGNVPMWNYPMDGCVLINDNLDLTFEKAIQKVKDLNSRKGIQNKYLEFYNTASIYRIFVDKLKAIGSK